MAWTSGIALILLPKGAASHKTFELSFHLTRTGISFLKLDSHKKRLRESDVIISNEDDTKKGVRNR